jgi:two-component system sensor histidine kinase KdpD
LLATIREESARLRRLVENLLDLSRLEAGVAQPHPELWPPEDLVAQALDEVGPRSAAVAVELGEAVPPVRVDAVQIQRVLANLIENALKFSPADAAGAGAGVRVEVEAVDGEVRLHVVDRGPGIPHAERERVFEPFRRLDGASRGAGLGLAIARGFAEANGGRVWAEGDRDGAHLVVALPAAG